MERHENFIVIYLGWKIKFNKNFNIFISVIFSSKNIVDLIIYSDFMSFSKILWSSL